MSSTQSIVLNLAIRSEPFLLLELFRLERADACLSLSLLTATPSRSPNGASGRALRDQASAALTLPPPSSSPPPSRPFPPALPRPQGKAHIPGQPPRRLRAVRRASLCTRSSGVGSRASPRGSCAPTQELTPASFSPRSVYQKGDAKIGCDPASHRELNVLALALTLPTLSWRLEDASLTPPPARSDDQVHQRPHGHVPQVRRFLLNLELELHTS